MRPSKGCLRLGQRVTALSTALCMQHMRYCAWTAWLCARRCTVGGCSTQLGAHTHVHVHVRLTRCSCYLSYTEVRAGSSSNIMRTYTRL
jgi:hypothetical protein